MAVVIGLPLCSNAAPYEVWAASNYPLSTDNQHPMADPDADGVPNLLEWYCGCSPSEAEPFPIGVERSVGGVTVWIERSSVAHEHVAGARLETSEDLVAWRSSPVGLQLVSVDGEIERLEAQLTDLTTPLFFRLAVSVDGGFEDSEYFARWSFDEVTLTDPAVEEGSGNGTDGVLKNGATRGPGIGAGSSLVLDGVDDYMDVELTQHLRLDSPTGAARAFTMAAWINLHPDATLNGEDDDYAILQKGSWTLPPFVEFGVRGGAYRGLYAKMYNSSGSGHAYDLLVPRDDVTAVVTDSQWHHVAFTRDADGVGRLYLDGQKIGEKMAMNSPADPPANAADVAVDGGVSPLNRLWVGRRYSRSGSYFDGSIDDLRLLRGALDSSDLAALMVEQLPVVGWAGWEGFAAPDPAATLFVAAPPVGDDVNDGSEDRPFATIGKALDVVHEDAAGPSRIYVRHGEYFEGIERVVNGDTPLTDRRSGELYITRPGITLEAEPWDGAEGRVVVKGSVRKEMPSGHPLAAKFPVWESIGDGLFRADRDGRDLNAQSLYLDGERLLQYGDAYIGSLTGVWRGKRYLTQNDPARLPEGSFYSPEKLELLVPASGGRGLRDGNTFKIERGSSSKKFEFSDRDDYRETAGNIIIRFSDGRDVFGGADGSGDTQQELVAKIIAALASPEADVLDLTGVQDAGGGVIALGERAGADGRHLLLATPSAPALSGHRYELYLKLPDGTDPNSPATNLEIPYRPQMLAVRAPHTKVKGFRFMYNNTSAYSSGAAILINAADVILEDNEVLWSDMTGVAFHAKSEGGIRPPVRRAILLNNRFSFCGNSGWGGVASRNCRFIGNDTSRNNWRQYSTSWHAGGFKLNNMHQGLVIQNHTARYNRGDGLWFDTLDPRHQVLGNYSVSLEQMGVEVSESVSELNERAGFFYEISRNGRFFDNVSRYNRLRGFYISNSVDCVCERNLVVGNGLEGIGVNASVLILKRPFFQIPYAHPLGNNWSNLFAYTNYGTAGISFVNNINRNNAIHVRDNHDPEGFELVARAGLGIGSLPVHASAVFPGHVLPGNTGASFPTGHAPLVGATSVENTSDHNVFWRTNETVRYGSSPAQSIGFGEYEEGQELGGRHLDLKDIDKSTDGSANRVLDYEYLIHPAGLISDYRAFPSDLEFDQHSVEGDRFEFLDPPLDPIELGAGRAVLDPDFDGDGMYDWWEAQHGLDPRLDEGIHGGAGDADGDGLSNLEEF
ncbi:MAG: hypothetical protein ACI9MB_000341, partial [Verrucomicrobiales bacterium]